MTRHADTDWGYAEFAVAAARLREQGHEVVNPHELDKALWSFDALTMRTVPPLMTRKRVLAFDLGIVLPTCDAIYLLPEWTWSSGAIAECAAAITYELVILLAPGAEAVPAGLVAQS